MSVTKLVRMILGALLALIILILVVFFITWAILQPQSPSFVLQDATIFAFNVTAPMLLTSNIAVTVTSRNPNNRIGIYYDRLLAYATYHSQQITYFTEIPRHYEDHNNIDVWSPFLYGTNVPVAPYNAVALQQDQASGSISLVININGRVRWRVGSFISGHYHLHVTCPAYIPFGNRNTGFFVGTAVKYQLAVQCSVNV